MNNTRPLEETASFTRIIKDSLAEQLEEERQWQKVKDNHQSDAVTAV